MVTEDVIINFSPMFKRLEDGVYLGPGLLKNNIVKYFWWPILYGNETVCSKHYSIEKTDLIGIADRWVLVQVKNISTVCNVGQFDIGQFGCWTSLVQHFGSSKFLDK